MIARIWRGWTTPENADTYQHLVLTEIIPAIEARHIPGFLQIDVLRALPAEGQSEIEFTTIMLFRDKEAIRAFMGENWTASHVPASARAVLTRFDTHAAHHNVLDRRRQPSK